MEIAGAATGVALFAIVYDLLLLWFDDKIKLELHKKGMVVLQPAVWAAGLLAAVVWAVRFLTAEWDMVTNILMLILLCTMAVVSVTDYYKERIPNQLLWCMLLCWVAVAGIFVILDVQNGVRFLFQAVAGGILAGVIFLLCYFLSRKQLGLGDVKLAFVMGLYLTGQRVMGAIFYGAILSCVFCVVQMIRKKLTMHDKVPFAPFLYLGTLITLLLT